ncbi:MAG: outer membrane protein OmpK [Pseudomonadota bacterium]|jgi:nucleoside-specific outer membrane channel protein Tsx
MHRFDRYRVPGALSAGCLFAALVSPTAEAGSADFATTNIQFLHGTRYADFDPHGGFSENDESSIITIEHFNTWKYGDNFMFVDITNPIGQGDAFGTTAKGNASYYAELSPRLSFGKMSGQDLSWGLIQDVLFTATLEIPESPVEQTWLYGLAVDLKLPGFQFFQVNWYIRNPDAPGVDTGQQITLVWGAPFKLGPIPMMFEGFLDYAWGVDPLKDNLITAPRLLVDVGDMAGIGAGKFQAGVEYQIWRNKFGIDGMDENVPQAMVKWIF